MEIGPLPHHLYGAACALWYDSSLVRPWNDRGEDLHRAMDGSASTLLGCVEEDRLVATAMVGHDGHRGWVYSLAVAEQQRRRGLGTAMMRACEQWLRARDVPKIQLMVRDSNASVIAFYTRLGYADAQVVVLGLRLDG